MVKINDINAKTGQEASVLTESVAVSQMENEITKQTYGLQSILSSGVARGTTMRDSSPYQKKEELTKDEKLEMFEKIGRVSKDNDGKIITNENEEEIVVTWKEYLKLLKFGGGWSRFLAL